MEILGMLSFQSKVEFPLRQENSLKGISKLMQFRFDSRTSAIPFVLTGISFKAESLSKIVATSGLDDKNFQLNGFHLSTERRKWFGVEN